MKAKKNVKLLDISFSCLTLLLILSSIYLLYRNHGVREDNFAHDLLLPEAYARYYDDLLDNMPSINHLQSNQMYPSPSPFFPPNAKLLAGASQNKTHNTLTLSYQGSDSGQVFNCQNGLLNADEQTTSYYYLNDKNQFTCATVKNGNPDLSSTLPLIENVDAVHIRFGEKKMTNNKQYKRFEEILNMDNINSIEITILLRVASQAQNLPVQQIYQMNQQAIGPYHDNIPRKVIRFDFPIQQSN